MVSLLPREDHPDLIVGYELADDAGVFRLNDDLALIQTVDFFTPIVDDPYTFGQIAAANALSDVYAMGGRPVTAMNILCFPTESFDVSVAVAILKGGFDKVHESGAALVGGHSVDDLELKYGLSVTGLISPKAVITNAGAVPGQVLVLTKPLGTGIIATAIKGGLASSEAEKIMVETMLYLNRQAAEAAVHFGVKGGTDVTGFGLLGHAREMAFASGVGLEIDSTAVPVLGGVADYVGLGMIPGGTYKNQSFCRKSMDVEPGVGEDTLSILADAQTSGGLLLAVDPDKVDDLLRMIRTPGAPAAGIIGRVTREPAGRLRIT